MLTLSQLDISARGCYTWYDPDGKFAEKKEPREPKQRSVSTKAEQKSPPDSAWQVNYDGILGESK